MEEKIRELSKLLEREYGKRVWKTDGDPLSVLVATILSQNTSDNNSHRAFANLKAEFKNWEEVRRARVKRIADAIRSGGLADIKASRIKDILSRIYEENGNLNLSFLRRWRTDKIKSWLGRFKGVGDKTVACVLLFSLRRPAMPVDTHMLRVSKRLGLVPPNLNAFGVEVVLEKMIPRGSIYQFHLNLIAHGRLVCKAANPLCHDCVLLENCEFGRSNFRP
jgi:endonuclease-3